MVCVFAVAGRNVAAEAPVKSGVINVWPGKPPHQVEKPTPVVDKGRGIVANIHTPTLAVHVPPAGKAVGSAVLICPGGGYAVVAAGHEGKDVASWLNGLGIHAFVLIYRCKPYRHPVPLMDARRALRWIRANAAGYGIRSDRIGVLGFSAGGHLASTVSTKWDAGKPDATDPLDRPSSRPDFSILVYPVITMAQPFTHKGSVHNLLGSDATDDKKREFSGEMQVNGRTPPAFLAHGTGDKAVPIQNSRAYAEALRKNGVAVKLVELDRPGHGWGMQKGWTEPCAEWLRGRGILPGP
jgi:acetyl esterase/lipase